MHIPLIQCFILFTWAVIAYTNYKVVKWQTNFEFLKAQPFPLLTGPLSLMLMIMLAPLIFVGYTQKDLRKGVSAQYRRNCRASIIRRNRSGKPTEVLRKLNSILIYTFTVAQIIGEVVEVFFDKIKNRLAS